MAAWTLPNRITDWCEILTTALDRRSRKYFLTIILGMLLGSGRRTVACWLRAAKLRPVQFGPGSAVGQHRRKRGRQK